MRRASPLLTAGTPSNSYLKSFDYRVFYEKILDHGPPLVFSITFLVRFPSPDAVRVMWFSRRKNPGPINFPFYLLFHAKVVSPPFIQQLPILVLASFSTSGLPYLSIYFYSFASRLPPSHTFIYNHTSVAASEFQTIVETTSSVYWSQSGQSIIAFVDSLLWYCYLPQFVLSLFSIGPSATYLWRTSPLALYYFLVTSWLWLFRNLLYQ